MKADMDGVTTEYITKAYPRSILTRLKTLDRS